MKLRSLSVPLVAIAALVMLASCSDDGANNGGKTPSLNDLYATQTAESSSAVITPTAAATQPAETPAQPFAEACQKSDEKQWSSPPPRIIDTNKTYIATIKTDKGEIVIELDNKPAVTTNNFVFLACKGFYDGLTFHRVVDNPPVAQGGDPTGTGSGGPGYSIPGEFEGAVFDTGVIGMARSRSPDSAGSQFYIMTGPAHSLDGQYAAFGHVTSGMDVVNSLTPRDPSTNPDAPPGDKMNEITITEQ